MSLDLSPFRLLPALLIATIGFAAPGWAADPVQQDKLFASEAVASSQTEIELAKLATKKARDSEVKQFAQHMLDEHGRMSEELTAILTQLKMQIPSEAPAKAKADLERLSQLQGADFDREYMKLMVESHDKAAAAFGDESEAGEQQQLKAFASTHLPTIREHLERALTLDGKMSVATQTPPSNPLQSQDESSSNRAEMQPQKPIAERTAADLVEQPVVTPEGDMIGKIKDIVLDQKTGRVLAIIPVGGVFSIGDKDIAIDVAKLRDNSDGEPRGSLLVDATEEDLESQPVFTAGEHHVEYPDDRAVGELGR